MTVRIFSFFTGIGFMDLGFEKAGYSIDLVNEYHEPFLKAYQYSRNKLRFSEPEHGYLQEDATILLEKEYTIQLKSYMQHSRMKSDFIGFIAGPPCPDFSIGGKNRGRKGDKGRLSASYIEFVCKYTPDFFLFENVKGLWTTKKHFQFYQEIKERVQQNGYFTTDNLINSIAFGVPQDRERVILIGFKSASLKNLGINIDHSRANLAKNQFPWFKYAKFDSNQVLSLPWPNIRAFEIDSDLPIPNGIIRELTVEHWFQKNDVTTHANSVHHFNQKAGLQKFLSIPEGDVSKKSYKRLHRWRYSPTVAYGNNEVHLHPYQARRLSVAEALSIQSLPKDFELPPDMTLSNMFKAIGNGVPYLVANALAKSILDFLSQNKYSIE